jgi:hypothetical protein
MGAALSRSDVSIKSIWHRHNAVTEFKRTSGGGTLPSNCTPASADDWAFMAACLHNVLLFKGLSSAVQQAVVSRMYERPVAAGEILIQEGDTGVG